MAQNYNWLGGDGYFKSPESKMKTWAPLVLQSGELTHTAHFWQSDSFPKWSQFKWSALLQKLKIATLLGGPLLRVIQTGTWSSSGRKNWQQMESTRLSPWLVRKKEKVMDSLGNMIDGESPLLRLGIEAEQPWYTFSSPHSIPTLHSLSMCF